MTAPRGYKSLPPDITCRCTQVWQELDGSYWCCGKSETLTEIERLEAAHAGEQDMRKRAEAEVERLQLELAQAQQQADILLEDCG